MRLMISYVISTTDARERGGGGGNMHNIGREVINRQDRSENTLSPRIRKDDGEKTNGGKVEYPSSDRRKQTARAQSNSRERTGLKEVRVLSVRGSVRWWWRWRRRRRGAMRCVENARGAVAATGAAGPARFTFAVPRRRGCDNKHRMRTYGHNTHDRPQLNSHVITSPSHSLTGSAVGRSVGRRVDWPRRRRRRVRSSPGLDAMGDGYDSGRLNRSLYIPA